MQKFQLGQAQCLRLGFVFFEQKEIELLDESCRRLVWHAPQRSDCRSRTGSQQSPAECLNAFAWHKFSLLRIACRQSRQAHTAEVYVIKLLKKKIIIGLPCLVRGKQKP